MALQRQKGFVSRRLFSTIFSSKVTRLSVKAIFSRGLEGCMRQTLQDGELLHSTQFEKKKKNLHVSH